MERVGGNNITQASLSTRDALDKYEIVTQKMKDLVANNPGDDEILAVVSEVPEIILRCTNRDEAALAVAQKALEALYENASSNLHVSANLAILVAIRDVRKLVDVVKELTSWVINSNEERKLNKDITIGLIQRELLNLAEYDVHMAKDLDGGRNKSATDFAVSLLESLVTQESSVISELHSLVDALAKVLKAHDDVIISPQLVKEIEKVNAAISASNAYGDDVQAEANAYFHQMFSGQLSVDAMVQKLSRYKDSLVQRENLIFDCVIANLFFEYRFFPMYPVRQLKIASIFFGSVIKHQLISSRTLGVALRVVLDCLRKPADSKLFLFGSKALEQFVNRLVELPRYCNLILRISHLRGTHPELVTVIEQALSKISAGKLESDASVSHPGPSQSQSFPGNGELLNSGIGQSALLLPSLGQPQQKNEVDVDDRSKVPSVPAKPVLPSSSTTSADNSVISKNLAAETETTADLFVNRNVGLIIRATPTKKNKNKNINKANTVTT